MKVKPWIQNLKMLGRLKLVLFILAFALVGASVLALLRAVSFPTTSIETENGDLTSSAIIMTDPLASNNQAVTFGLPNPPPTSNKPMPPANGVLTGIVRVPRGSNFTLQGRKDSIQTAEAQIGRKNDTDRQFYSWGDTFDNNIKPYMEWTSLEGRIPVINLSVKNGSTITLWSNIANGSQDIYLMEMATQIKLWNKPAFFIFHHEPQGIACDNGKNPCAGNATDYVAAWRHLRQVFNDVGISNLAYMWDVVPSFSQMNLDYTRSLYPGDDIIDWLAVNPFNLYESGNNWKDVVDLSTIFYSWASTKGKPIAFGAYGTNEDSAQLGTRKSQWFANAQSQIKNSMPALKLMEYYDSPAYPPGIPYDWSVDSTPQSLDAYRNMVLDQYYNPLNH